MKNELNEKSEQASAHAASNAAAVAAASSTIAQSAVERMLRKLPAHIPRIGGKRTISVALRSDTVPGQASAQAVEQAMLQEVVSTVTRALAANPGGADHCILVLPNVWVEWASIPWLGPKLRDDERSSIIGQRLNALYGPSTDRHLAVSKVRFGCGQWVAATSRTRIQALKKSQGLQDALVAHGIAKFSLVPAHAAALEAYARWRKIQTSLRPGSLSGHATHVYRLRHDRLFATVDGTTVTVSWWRYPHPELQSQTPPPPQGDSYEALPEPVIGIRNLVLDTSGFGPEQWSQEIIRCLQREVLLQRLSDPIITVIALDGASTASATPVKVGVGQSGNQAVNEKHIAAEIFSNQWEVLLTPNWQTLIDPRGKTGDRSLGQGLGHESRNIKPAFVREFVRDFDAPSADVLMRPFWPRLMLGLAVLGLVAAGFFYQHEANALAKLQESMEQSITEQLAKTQKVNFKESPQSALERAQRAQALLARASLDVPWESLFQCVESSVSGDITLSQIQPDPHGGELVIAGDARTFKAIGAMVTKLEENADGSIQSADVAPSSVAALPASGHAERGGEKPTTLKARKPEFIKAAACRDLRLPYISSFQINEQDPQKTLHFEIRANWRKASAPQSNTVPAASTNKASDSAGVAP